ncbi:hypothetical protein ACQPZF_27355 [Actinosynnema sp. CS-041913]|uniref:hypothetical protein n=1 Tax=Actinosynnema sp. CS-041913 TaxID=3239917 RepID=UPI003D9293A2
MKRIFSIIAALPLTLTALLVPNSTASAEGGPADFMPPPPDCGDRIQVYARTQQPVNAWQLRVTGAGLSEILPGGAGRVFLSFDDDDASENRDVFIDSSHPLSVFAVVNGARIAIYVSVTDLDNRVTYCATTKNVNHP